MLKTKHIFLFFFGVVLIGVGILGSVVVFDSSREARFAETPSFTGGTSTVSGVVVEEPSVPEGIFLQLQSKLQEWYQNRQKEEVFLESLTPPEAPQVPTSPSFHFGEPTDSSPDTDTASSSGDREATTSVE